LSVDELTKYSSSKAIVVPYKIFLLKSGHSTLKFLSPQSKELSYLDVSKGNVIVGGGTIVGLHNFEFVENGSKTFIIVSD